MQTKTGRVLRSFYYERKALKAGDTVTLPSLFAREMVAANKLELVSDAPEALKKAMGSAAASGPELPPAGEPADKPKSKGGKKDAG